MLNDVQRCNAKSTQGNTRLVVLSDQTREMAFIVDAGGRLELFEAKWTELPAVSDAANLRFVREAVGKSRIAGGAIICRARNSFPLTEGFRALPAKDLA